MSTLKPYYHNAPVAGTMRTFANVEYPADTPPDAIKIGPDVYCRVAAKDRRLSSITTPLLDWLEAHESIRAHNPLMERQLIKICDEIERDHERRVELTRVMAFDTCARLLKEQRKKLQDHVQVG